jgi:hypothetical protein
MKPKYKHLHLPNITYIYFTISLLQTNNSTPFCRPFLLGGDNICKRPTEDSRHKAKLGITKKGKY